MAALDLHRLLVISRDGLTLKCLEGQARSGSSTPIPRVSPGTQRNAGCAHDVAERRP